MSRKNKLAYAGLVTALVFGSAGAHAAIDLTEVTDALGDLVVVVTTIGGALVGAAAVAVAFKWAKGALFG